MADGLTLRVQDKRGALAISPTIVILIGKHGVFHSSLILMSGVAVLSVPVACSHYHDCGCTVACCCIAQGACRAAAGCEECTAGKRVPRSGLPRVFVCALEQGIIAP